MPQRDFACLHLQPQHWALLRDLLARYTPQAEAWAYGSRVDGTGHDTSDLDMVLRHPTDLSQDVPGWDDLKEAIQNSRLPILVDLPGAYQAARSPSPSGGCETPSSYVASPLTAGTALHSSKHPLAWAHHSPTGYRCDYCGSYPPRPNIRGVNL